MGEFSDFVSIGDKFKKELIEIRLNVHALKLFLVMLAHQHKVRVDLKPAILSQHQPNMVMLLGQRVCLDHGAKLEQFGD